jgi:hypothetical protein
MIFIGLDTHKEFHELTYCEEQRGATPAHYGRIPSSKVSVKYTNMLILSSLFTACGYTQPIYSPKQARQGST